MRSIVPLAVLATVGLASGHTGTFGSNYTDDATALRKQLLRDYDPKVPAKSSSRQASYTSAGTDVRMDLRIFKIMEVEPSRGLLKIKVWLRFQWIDDRLKWRPENHGGLTFTHVWADTRPTGLGPEIWVPDIQPWNSFTAMADTLDPVPVVVNSDGSVYFSRPGTLDIMCKFSGLVAFPFDHLKCGVEFGGWLWGGGHQGISVSGAGWSLGTEATARSSYQEYAITDVNVSTTLREYECCPNDPYPTVLYMITMRRAKGFYQIVVVVPVVIVTTLSFAVFFAPTAAADPLGYGISVIVVVFLMQIVLIELLPICGEVLWVDMFIMTNTLFCMVPVASRQNAHLALRPPLISPCHSSRATHTSCVWPRRVPPPNAFPPWCWQLALLQSCVTIMIENIETEHAFPEWIWYTWRRMRGYRSAEAANQASKTWRAKSNESVAGVLFRQLIEESAEGAEEKARKRTGRRRPSTKAVAADAQRDGTPLRAAVNPTLRPTGSWVLSDDDAHRLVYFENLFFRIDENMSGSVSEEECFSFFTFAALDMHANRRRAAFTDADSNKDGFLSRLEFCQLCIDELWNVPIQQLDLAIENVHSARTALARKYRAQWQKFSGSIDTYARVAIPTLYILSQFIIFGLELDDRYLEDPTIEMGQQAVVVRGFNPLAAAGVVVVIVVSLVSGVAFLNLKHITNNNKKRYAEAEEENQARVTEQECIAASFSEHREKRLSAFIEESELAQLKLPDTGGPSGAGREKELEA